MTDVLKHRFSSPKLDGADAQQVQPSHWNDGHRLIGGNDGDLLTRSTADANFGAAWLPRTTLIPGVQAYTPAFMAAGAVVPIGNGTLVGMYQQIGKLTWVHVHLTFGTTTPGPAGAWAFTLPFALFDGVNPFVGLAFNGASQWQVVTSSIGYAQEAQMFSPGNPMVAVTNTVPFTWAPGCHLAITGTYRAT